MADQRKPIQITGIGGGNGSPHLLAALAELMPDARITSIVPVSDNGRSTGLVRNALEIPAPGDVRNALSILGRSSPWADILNLRLRAPNHPHLDGVAVGNLVVGALIQRSGDIHAASRELATLLESRVEVLPVSIEHVQLAAVLSGGDTVRGESRVRALGQPPIEHVFLENEISGVSPGAAAALAGADAVIVGPGALWTSLAATLATKGVREALAPSARILYVCNTTTQPGQTDGLGATDHVAIVAKYLGRAPDVVLLNRAEPPPRLGEALRRDGLCPLPVTPEEIARIETNGSKVVLADLLASVSVRPELWKKQDTAYHDMPLTAATLLPHITRCPPE